MSRLLPLFILVALLTACASPATEPQVIVVTATPEPTPASAPTEVGQAKWEYRVIVFNNSPGGVFVEVVDDENCTPTGAAITTDTCYTENANEAIVNKLNELGADGWELVSVVLNPIGQGGTATMIFKRPISP